MTDDKDLIYNKQSQAVNDTEASATAELASNKALHDEKVEEDIQPEQAGKEEPVKEDFDRFNLDAVEDLKETKSTEE